MRWPGRDSSPLGGHRPMRLRNAKEDMFGPREQTPNRRGTSQEGRP
jgi:hypothetical protein